MMLIIVISLVHLLRPCIDFTDSVLVIFYSGIGKTVKEKVCVHSSRDIRAVASQLVNVWIELFRKEKAANGGLKLLRQSTATDTSKSKHIAALGKPPIRNHPSAVDSKRSSKVSLSAGNHLAVTVNKKLNVKPATLETIADVEPSASQASVGRQNDTTEESQNFPMSDEEKAAFAAAEAARVAALAAAEVSVL